MALPARLARLEPQALVLTVLVALLVRQVPKAPQAREPLVQPGLRAAMGLLVQQVHPERSALPVLKAQPVPAWTEPVVLLALRVLKVLLVQA